MAIYEHFTEAAIRTTILAQEEARCLGQTCIGTELVLFSLIKEEGGLASKVLNSLDVDLAKIQSKVEQINGSSPEIDPSKAIRYSPKTERIVIGSVAEASKLGSNVVDTEHLLLALLQEQESTAVRVLEELGIELEQLRNRIHEAINE